MTTTAETDTVQTPTNPPVKGGAVPYLMLSDASAAADLYKRAFGAEEVARQSTGDHRLIHCHLYINGGSVMLSDPFPEHGHPWQPPQAFNIHLQVEDINAWFSRAVEAGMGVVMPVQLQFWGDRYGMLRDPFGVTWAMGERKA